MELYLYSVYVFIARCLIKHRENFTSQSDSISYEYWAHSNTFFFKYLVYSAHCRNQHIKPTVNALDYTQHTCTNLKFCWPCIIVYQYSETNVMQFLFSLLRIKGLYMFRALLTHLQEALHKRHLVYCVRVMSVGCTKILVQPTDITRTQYTKFRLCSAS
jgi:hypothetical protein